MDANDPLPSAEKTLLRKAWDKAADELGEDEKYKDDLEWLRRYPSDPENPAAVLNTFLTKVQSVANRLRANQPSAAGRLSGLRRAAHSVLKVINDGSALASRFHDPALAAMSTIAQPICDEADDETLTYLYDCLSVAYDNTKEARRLLHMSGPVPSIEDAVIALHALVLKFWACAGRKMYDEKAAKHKRYRYQKYIEPRSQQLQKDLATRMDSLQHAIKEEEAKADILQKSRREAESMLRKGNVSSTHDFLQSRWEENTCQWIHNDKQFEAWLGSSGPNILWIHAAAGMGKSMLAWYTIEHVLNPFTPGKEKLFFYCTHEHSSEQATAGEVLRSLVYQVLEKHWDDRSDPQQFSLYQRLQSDSRCLALLIKQFWSAGDDFENLTKESLGPHATTPPTSVTHKLTLKLEKLLLGVCDYLPVYIVLDGLDEYRDDEMSKLLRILTPLCHPRSGSETPLVKLLLFSRPTVYLVAMRYPHEAGIPYAGEAISAFELPDVSVKDDVRTYLRAGLGRHLATFADPVLTKDEVRNTAEEFVWRLVPAESKAPPFQWAYLLLQDICQHHSLAQLKKWFNEGNFRVNKLDEFYARVLLRLESKLGAGMRESMISVLAWATYASRVLTTAELTELLRLQDASYTEQGVCRFIRAYCGSIFRLERRSSGTGEQRAGRQGLHFIHFSVAEFLREVAWRAPFGRQPDGYAPHKDQGPLVLPGSGAHRKIFKDCLTYLCTSPFERSFVRIRGNATVRAKLEERYPFFSYAANQWPYHLTKVVDAPDVARCVIQLNDFFHHAAMRTWMEGMLAIGEGGEWLSTLCAQIKKWLQNRREDKQQNVPDCPNFDGWVADITNSGFRDYEQTLLHNNNEVHFVDQDILLPSIPNAPSSRQDQDCLQYLKLPKDENAAFLSNYPNITESDDIQSELLPDACIPSSLFVGEDADNRLGFFSLDRNRTVDRGIFLIDKTTNHPRLLWQKVSQPTSAPGEREPDSRQRERIRLASVIPLSREIEHSQFTALSAALSDDGTTLAALYREDVKDGNFKLRLIFWSFNADGLDAWRRAVDDGLSRLTLSLSKLRQAITVVKRQERRVAIEGRKLLERRMPNPFADDDDHDDLDSSQPMTTPLLAPQRCEDSEKAAVTFSSINEYHAAVTHDKNALLAIIRGRSAAPSTQALENGAPWVSVAELVPKDCPAAAMKGDQKSAFATSPYSIAFLDATTLVLPCGLLDTATARLQEYPADTLRDITGTLTIVPRGRFLVYPTQNMQGLVVVNLKPSSPPWGRKRVWKLDHRAAGPNFRVARVVDCSDSGHCVAVEVDGLRAGHAGLAVVDLYQLTGRIVFHQDAAGGRFSISRAFFCRQDRHLLVVTRSRTKTADQSVYAIFMVDVHAAHVSALGKTQKAILAVAHFRCQGPGCVKIICDKNDTISSAMTHSLSSSLNLRLRDSSSLGEPATLPLPLLDYGPEDFDERERQLVQQEVDRELSTALGTELIFRALTSPSHAPNTENGGTGGITAVTIVFEDRSVRLVEIGVHNAPAKGLEPLSDGRQYLTATCKPSWSGDRVCAAYLTVELGNLSPNTTSIIHAKLPATVQVKMIRWRMDLNSRCDTLQDVFTSQKFELPVLLTDLICRGLSLSRNTETLAYWVGPELRFLRRHADSTVPLDIKKDLARTFLAPAERSLTCLEVVFSQNDKFAAVLWSNPPESPEEGQRARGSLLELYDLTRAKQDNKVIIRDSLVVDCDARAFHFHPFPETDGHLMTVTTVDSVLLLEYGTKGFTLRRRLGETQVKESLVIPDETNGPPSPRSTEETTREAPIAGLAPLYFSTCGYFVFSHEWNAFAVVRDLIDPSRPLSGRRVVDAFRRDVERANAASNTTPPGGQTAASGPFHQSAEAGTTLAPVPPHWRLPKNHPRVMYENVLYAVGRHRLKIFRIRTYIVLGWSAEGHNLFIMPPPKQTDPPTWYRRVLCAVPQSISMWRATLIWPDDAHPADFMAVLLFPPPGADIVAMPMVIHCPLKRLHLETTSIVNDGNHTDGWLRGHAFGCPYQLKATSLKG